LQWSYLVKSGHANELSPLDPDWLFYKAAAIARQIYVSKSINVGVGTLKAFLGKKKRNGVRPPRYSKAGGKVIREIVSQLKKNGYVENYANQEGSTFGLVLTKAGRAELDKIASRLIKDRPLGK
jgi:small subunit ribosomal protein S19e